MAVKDLALLYAYLIKRYVLEELIVLDVQCMNIARQLPMVMMEVYVHLHVKFFVLKIK